MTEPRWETYPNFKRHEFVCRCGCGRADMEKDLMDTLQGMRTQLRFPFIVTSGFRCPEYNDKVSSTGRDGPHTHGLAVDIQVYGHRATRLLRASMERGFTGFGVAQVGDHSRRFLHIDKMPVTEGDDEQAAPRPWVWSY